MLSWKALLHLTRFHEVEKKGKGIMKTEDALTTFDLREKDNYQLAPFDV
jgi:hypothetical protein